MKTHDEQFLEEQSLCMALAQGIFLKVSGLLSQTGCFFLYNVSKMNFIKYA